MAPVGLEGEQRMMTRDFGVMAALSFSTVSRKPSCGVVSTTTGLALAITAISV